MPYIKLYLPVISDNTLHLLRLLDDILDLVRQHHHFFHLKNLFGRVTALIFITFSLLV